MMTRLTIPSVKGRRSILTGSLPATQAAVPSATAAALPQVTMPHPAPVNSAMRLPAASISSSRLTNCREAASIAARTCGSIRLPPCIVRTLQQLMNGRTPRARYGLALLFMSASETGRPDYIRAAHFGVGAIPPSRRLRWQFHIAGGRDDVGAKARRRGSVGGSIGRQRKRKLAEFPGGDRSHREAAFRD